MNAGSYPLEEEQYIEQLKAELQQQKQQLAVQQQRNVALRKKFAEEFGHELLALIEGDPRAKVFVTNVVEKLVLRDEHGNVISKTNGIRVSQIVEVKLVEPVDRDN